MTTHILGIGVGLFIIFTLWFSATLILALSLRINKKIGVITVIVVAIITIILISVPRNSESPNAYQEKSYDQLFIWRIILLIVLVGSSIIALFGYAKYEFSDSKEARKIANWVH